jgi:hypothetical protein
VLRGVIRDEMTAIKEEEVSKLLRIEEELGAAAYYPGRNLKFGK